MSKPTLYYMQLSGPCRLVMMVGKMVGVEFDLKHLDLMKKEHLTPEFLKLNPFHKIPTFVETDGFSLGESRAIATYLVQSRQPDSELYPAKDLKKRAQIDKWLQYDGSSFYPGISAPIYASFHGRKPTEESWQHAEQVLKTLNEVLGTLTSKYLTGNHLTVADVSMYFSANLTEIVPQYNLEKYPNIKKWYESVGEELKRFDKDLVESPIEDMKRRFKDHFPQ